MCSASWRPGQEAEHTKRNLLNSFFCHFWHQQLQLFPGIWFSHAGQLESVELVVQPSQVSSLACVQILRPYCSPDLHLVPPGTAHCMFQSLCESTLYPPLWDKTLFRLTGCSFLLNPFSCCSAAPLCNTTGGCNRGQHWCHLTEACVPAFSPCSTYDAATESRRFAPLPRYNAVPPFYHLVADLPFQIDPSPEFQTLNVSYVLLNDNFFTWINLNFEISCCLNFNIFSNSCVFQTTRSWCIQMISLPSSTLGILEPSCIALAVKLLLIPPGAKVTCLFVVQAGGMEVSPLCPPEDIGWMVLSATSEWPIQIFLEDLLTGSLLKPTKAGIFQMVRLKTLSLNLGNSSLFILCPMRRTRFMSKSMCPYW